MRWVAADVKMHTLPPVEDLLAKLDRQGIQDVEIMRAPDPSDAIPYGVG